MRLIDADALKNKIQSHHYRLTDSLKTVNYGMFTAEIMEDIDKSEIIKDRKHSRWEGYVHSAWYGFDDFGEPIYRNKTVWYCSKCRRKTIIKENFCPSCGADMRSE